MLLRERDDAAEMMMMMMTMMMTMMIAMMTMIEDGDER